MNFMLFIFFIFLDKQPPFPFVVIAWKTALSYSSKYLLLCSTEESHTGLDIKLLHNLNVLGELLNKLR